MARFFMLSLITLLGVSACGRTFAWPAVAKCAEPSAQQIQDAAAVILKGPGDYKAGLEGLAVTYSAGAVVCAVNELVKQWSAPPARPSLMAAMQPGPELERAQKFLASTHTVLQ